MRALLVSPHLDDAAFSAGATAAMLASRGWQVTVATVFSGGRHPTTGFALECQRDKGLSDDVDYMALRRAEDSRALDVLGATAAWLDLPEAPQRGYQSAPALFGEFALADDPAPITQAILRLIAGQEPDLILAPSALGAHVDHRRVLDAVLEHGEPVPVAFWRDTPYIIRTPDAQPDARVGGLESVTLPITDTITAKIAAARCYASQLGFQFGGPDRMAAALRDLALREAGERFYATPAALRLLQGHRIWNQTRSVTVMAVLDTAIHAVTPPRSE